MTSEEQLNKILLFTLIGAGLGARGVYDNVINGDEPFDPVHIVTTIAAHATAGAILGLQGEEFEEASFFAIAVAVAEVFDRKVNPLLESGINAVLGRNSQ